MLSRCRPSVWDDDNILEMDELFITNRLYIRYILPQFKERETVSAETGRQAGSQLLSGIGLSQVSGIGLSQGQTALRF